MNEKDKEFLVKLKDLLKEYNMMVSWSDDYAYLGEMFIKNEDNRWIFTTNGYWLESNDIKL